MFSVLNQHGKVSSELPWYCLSAILSKNITAEYSQHESCCLLLSRAYYLRSINPVRKSDLKVADQLILNGRMKIFNTDLCRTVIWLAIIGWTQAFQRDMTNVTFFHLFLACKQASEGTSFWGKGRHSWTFPLLPPSLFLCSFLTYLYPVSQYRACSQVSITKIILFTKVTKT